MEPGRTPDGRHPFTLRAQHVVFQVSSRIAEVLWLGLFEYQ